MKKLSILTFFKDEENYGAVLQALAMSHVLSRLGFDTEIVLFSSKRSKPSFLRIIRSVVWSVARGVLGARTRRKRTFAFEKKYAKLSVEIETVEGLHRYLKTRDICIVGSDQVWNPQLFEEGQNPFLLDGLEGVKKVSYAASFGISELSTKQSLYYGPALSHFFSVSVREDSGAQILRKMGLNAPVVLDPTLLLRSDDWNNKESRGRLRFKGAYLLCYVMPGKSEVPTLYRVAESVARERGLQVIFLGDREYVRFFGKKIDTTAGPAEFLKYFHNAEFVVTNSFHGTCFAVNYEKEFISVLGKEREFFGQNRNSRIVSILKKLGLSHRVVYSDNKNRGEVSQINWGEVRKILDRERKLSLEFIERNVLS